MLIENIHFDRESSLSSNIHWSPCVLHIHMSSLSEAICEQCFEAFLRLFLKLVDTIKMNTTLCLMKKNNVCSVSKPLFDARFYEYR